MNEIPEKDSEDRLRSAIEAYHASALAYAAVKLGLPEKMGARPWTAEALAAELGLSLPHLLRFLRGLASLGICEERIDGNFALTRLVSTLQTGAPAFDRAFGTDVWAWRNENFRGGDIFAAYLAGETFAGAAPIVEVLDLSSVDRVADIGGGHGGLLAAILQAHPGMRGILFDLPETIIGAKKFLKSQGVIDRTTLVGGDFLAEIPVEADLYLLKSVLQHWDDMAARAILESCRDTMPPRARLAIIERLVPEAASGDPGAVMVDLHMMVITGGRLRTLAEFETLLRQAGLAMLNVRSAQSGLSIVEVLPA
jgi:hypothetical protein